MIHNDAKRAFLYPTMRCNLKCAICYSGAHKPIVQERMKEELTFEEYKMVVDKLYGMGVRIFDISGGEPLLCEFIYDLIRNTYHLGLLFISCGAVGVDIYIVFTICKISEQKYQEDKIKILQFQNICQEQQIKEIKRSEKRIRRLRHDYRNTLLNLKSLIENGNIQESLVYLEKIDNYYIKESKEYIFTGNSLIDVTLNSKFNICHENEIELYSYIIGEYDTIDGFAISIILFNLLDNAIEAERKVEQREVYFEMIMKNEYVSCIVKNKINQSVLQNNKGLKTNKKNTEEHGLGIEHVKELVENIDGMFEVFELKDNFCVHVMIPLESLQLQNRKEE